MVERSGKEGGIRPAADARDVAERAHQPIFSSEQPYWHVAVLEKSIRDLDQDRDIRGVAYRDLESVVLTTGDAALTKQGRIRMLAQHELGELFEATARNDSNPYENGHCTSQDVMMDGTMKQLSDCYDPNKPYCDDCIARIRDYLTDIGLT